MVILLELQEEDVPKLRIFGFIGKGHPLSVWKNSLDIGTTKICAVVGEPSENGGMDIVGIGTSPSTGLRKGVVVNIEQTVQSIKRALEEAELMAGCEIRSVYAGIAGSHIKGFNSHGVIAVKGGEVSPRDIERALDAAKAGKTAACTVRALDILQRRYGADFPRIFKTITVDNGCEFADVKGIEKDGRTQLYFCHPYSSWERGSNENLNKMIRRFVPKGFSINKVSRKQVHRIQTFMNSYPRKILGWRCADDVFYEAFLKEGINLTGYQKQ